MSVQQTILVDNYSYIVYIAVRYLMKYPKIVKAFCCVLYLSLFFVVCSGGSSSYNNGDGVGDGHTVNIPPDENTRGGDGRTINTPPDDDDGGGDGGTATLPPDEDDDGGDGGTATIPPDDDDDGGDGGTATIPPDDDNDGGDGGTATLPPDDDDDGGDGSTATLPPDDDNDGGDGSTATLPPDDDNDGGDGGTATLPPDEDNDGGDGGTATLPPDDDDDGGDGSTATLPPDDDNDGGDGGTATLPPDDDNDGGDGGTATLPPDDDDDGGVGGTATLPPDDDDDGGVGGTATLPPDEDDDGGVGGTATLPPDEDDDGGVGGTSTMPPDGGDGGTATLPPDDDDDGGDGGTATLPPDDDDDGGVGGTSTMPPDDDGDGDENVVTAQPMVSIQTDMPEIEYSAASTPAISTFTLTRMGGDLSSELGVKLHFEAASNNGDFHYRTDPAVFADDSNLDGVFTFLQGNSGNIHLSPTLLSLNKAKSGEFEVTIPEGAAEVKFRLSGRGRLDYIITFFTRRVNLSVSIQAKAGGEGGYLLGGANSAAVDFIVRKYDDSEEEIEQNKPGTIFSANDTDGEDKVIVLLPMARVYGTRYLTRWSSGYNPFLKYVGSRHFPEPTASYITRLIPEDPESSSEEDPPEVIFGLQSQSEPNTTNRFCQQPDTCYPLKVHVLPEGFVFFSFDENLTGTIFARKVYTYNFQPIYAVITRTDKSTNKTITKRLIIRPPKTNCGDTLNQAHYECHFKNEYLPSTLPVTTAALRQSLPGSMVYPKSKYNLIFNEEFNGDGLTSLDHRIWNAPQKPQVSSRGLACHNVTEGHYYFSIVHGCSTSIETYGKFRYKYGYFEMEYKINVRNANLYYSNFAVVVGYQEHQKKRFLWNHYPQIRIDTMEKLARLIGSEFDFIEYVPSRYKQFSHTYTNHNLKQSKHPSIIPYKTNTIFEFCNTTPNKKNTFRLPACRRTARYNQEVTVTKAFEWTPAGYRQYIKIHGIHSELKLLTGDADFNYTKYYRAKLARVDEHGNAVYHENGRRYEILPSNSLHDQYVKNTVTVGEKKLKFQQTGIMHMPADIAVNSWGYPTITDLYIKSKMRVNYIRIYQPENGYAGISPVYK